jgi:nucleoside-diphosphate-sugar epimerase
MKSEGLMKNIIITGSSGLVATELICHLLNNGGYKIYAVSTNPDKLKNRYKAKKNIMCLTLNELKNVANDKPFLALVNCAFARNKSGRDIASSLEFLRELIYIVKGINLRAFINISSQSVYGQKEKPLWTEETPVNPDYLYAVGKYASEVIVKSTLSDTDINFTNIRLASVCQNARFLNVFVKNAIAGFPINVMGGSQLCSFIDVRDVVDALTAVLKKVDQIDLAGVYNLGTGKTRTILELAEDVRRIYKTKYGKDVVIEREDADIKLEVGIDNTLFCQTFNWQPKLNYDDMISSLIEFNLCGGGYPVAFDIVYRKMVAK